MVNRDNQNRSVMGQFLRRQVIKAFNQGVEARLRLKDYLMRNYEDFINHL